MANIDSDAHNYMIIFGCKYDENDDGEEIYELNWTKKDVDPLTFAKQLKEAGEALEQYAKANPDIDIFLSID